MRFTWATESLTYSTYLVRKHGDTYYALADNGLGDQFLGTSTNLRSWAYEALPSVGECSEGFGDVMFNGVRYIIAGRHDSGAQYDHKIFSSADAGATWQERTLPSAPAAPTNGGVLCWNDVREEFLFLTVTGSYVASSPDGITWEDLGSNLPSATRIALVSIGGRYVTCEAGGGGATHQSKTGASWAATDGPFGGLAVSQGLIWSGSAGANVARTSANGMNWNAITDEAQYTYATNGDDDDTVIAVNASSLITSSDGGLNWVYTDLPPGSGTYFDMWWVGGELFVFDNTDLHIGTRDDFWTGHVNTQETN